MSAMCLVIVGRHHGSEMSAPVLTLWAAVVAERLGFDRPTA